jgi:hypothetical protein
VTRGNDGIRRRGTIGKIRSMNKLEQADTVERRPSRITLAARGAITAAAALYLLHRSRRAKTHGHFDDAQVVETQEAEQPVKQIHHFATRP